MILLSGHSLTPTRRIPLEKMSLSLKERESTAEIVPADMDGITLQSWMKDDTQPGSGIVWRVRSIQQNYSEDTPTVQLDHAINTLRDRILFGEITPATITGTVGATTCTAKQAVQYILNQQSDWTLDSFSYNSVSNPYKFDGDSLYDALEKVTDTLDDAWWSYDFTTYPFKLSITTKPSGVACELKPGRNLSTISKTIDRSGMYTRFYPIGKDDLHVSGNYVSKNESTYGVISRVEVDQSLTTTAELTAWANERLNKHAQPVVNITVEALELADATGESLDRLKLGRLCRIPLHEFNTTITERIVEMNYQDKVNEPEAVKLTLANTRNDAAHLIADVIKKSGSGGRGGARQQAEDHAWFEDTDEYVAMVAEKTGINQLGQQETLYGRIQVEAGKITQIVSAVGENGQVTAASIIAAVNNGSSSIVLSADHIDIDGIVDELTAMTVEVDTLLATGVDVSGTIAADEVDATSSLTVNGYDVLVSNITKNQAGDTITVSFVDGTSWTFSKPASQQVTLSGAWSGRTFSVTASPSSGATPSIVNGVVYDGIVPVSGTAAYDSTHNNVTQDFIVYSDDGNGDADAQIMRKTLSISVPFSAITARKVLSSGGTAYYQAGSSTLYYMAGTTTVVGRGDQVTAMEVLASGGTAYYQAGSSTLYYMAGTTTVVGRGDQVTAREVLNSGGTLYYNTSAAIKVKNYGSYTFYLKKQNASGTYYESVGTHNWYYEDSGGTQYYTRSNGPRLGSSTVYYKGNGGTKTVQGGETYITPVSGSAIHLGASDTYYKGNGGTKTVQGGETYITPVSGSAIHLGAANTYYELNT